MEKVFVGEIMRGRKKYLNALVDETHRLTIVWNSAPLPDVELLIQASEKGLCIPAEMVGAIVASELGLEELREEFARKERMEDKQIEHYLKRKNLKVSSKTTGAEKNGSGGATSKTAKAGNGGENGSEKKSKKAKTSPTKGKEKSKDKDKEKK
jgi:hypothetical protein